MRTTGGGFELGRWALPLFDNGAETFLAEVYQHADAFLFGRRTYEIFAGYWGVRADSGAIAAALNTRPKYVASTTLTDPQCADTTARSGDVAAAVAELKAKPGGGLQVLGSGLTWTAGSSTTTWSTRPPCSPIRGRRPGQAASPPPARNTAPRTGRLAGHPQRRDDPTGPPGARSMQRPRPKARDIGAAFSETRTRGGESARCSGPFVVRARLPPAQRCLSRRFSPPSANFRRAPVLEPSAHPRHLLRCPIGAGSVGHVGHARFNADRPYGTRNQYLECPLERPRWVRCDRPGGEVAYTFARPDAKVSVTRTPWTLTGYVNNETWTSLGEIPRHRELRPFLTVDDFPCHTARRFARLRVAVLTVGPYPGADSDVSEGDVRWVDGDRVIDVACCIRSKAASYIERNALVVARR